MPRREDVSNDLREAIVAAINLVRLRPFPNILKLFYIIQLFYSREDYSQVENIQDSRQSSQEWTSPRSDCALLRETAKQELHLRLYRP